MWLSFPDNVPDVSGYYVVEYYHTLNQRWHLKSLWFNSETNIWQGPWPWSYDRVPTKVLKDGKQIEVFRILHKGLNVKRFVPETFDRYYVPSMMKFEELLESKGRSTGQ